MEIISESYSLTNQKKYDISYKTQKHILYQQFVAWNCNGYSITHLTDYINNPIYQELHELKDFVSIWMMEDPMKNLETSTSGLFQLYFFKKTFNPTKIVVYKNAINLKENNRNNN